MGFIAWPAIPVVLALGENLKAGILSVMEGS